jgi:hypothetical protein
MASSASIPINRPHGQLDYVFHLHYFLHQKRLRIFHAGHLTVIPRDQVHFVMQAVEGDIDL